MAEIIQETVTRKSDSSPTTQYSNEEKATQSQTVEYLIYFFFGLLDILLAFRLVLKIMGASTASGFVRAIYSITGLFIMPFEGIFRRGFTQGLETTSVIEPSTVVALFVYAVLAWGIVKLVRIGSGNKQQSE